MSRHAAGNVNGDSLSDLKPTRGWRYRGQHRLSRGRQTVRQIARWLELNPPQSIRNDMRLWRREKMGDTMTLLTSPWTGEQFLEFAGSINIPSWPETAATIDIDYPIADSPGPTWRELSGHE